MSSYAIAKLLDLKQVTRLTGTLDELQIHNLQMWGRIAFPDRKFGLNWNGTERTLEYDIISDGCSIEYPNFDRALTALDTSVKEMLGEEWVFTLKIDGKRWFTGPRKMPFRPAAADAPLAPERGELPGDVRGNS